MKSTFYHPNSSELYQKDDETESKINPSSPSPSESDEEILIIKEPSTSSIIEIKE